MPAQTFAQSRAAILAHLASLGWACKPGLKVPHATRPDGAFRLWFKPQAVHYTESNTGTHDAGDARAILQFGLDIRDMPPAQFVAFVSKLFP